MRILHLYHDIMNLYGEYANVLAMQRILQKSGIDCTVDRLTVGDNADLSAYDFIYIGSGTEKNQRVVLDDFKKYTDTLKDLIASGKVILMTGNSFEMLGKTITDAEKNHFDGLGIFNFTTVEQNQRRVTADAVFIADFTDRPLVGFINKCSEISGVETPLFEVKMGLGNKDGEKYEGIRKNNFFGTHLTGPLLIKNPYFLEYMAGLLVKSPQELKTDYLSYERAGYEVTLSELEKRMNENI